MLRRKINKVFMSFPRKRESIRLLQPQGMDSRIRGNDNRIIRWMFAIFCVSSLTFALSGCNPYEFHIGGPHIIDAVVITSLGGVDQGDYMATLRDTAAVDLNYFGATQYH